MREAHTRIYYTMVSSILFGSPCCAGIPALGKRTQPNRRRSFETVNEAAEAVPLRVLRSKDLECDWGPSMKIPPTDTKV